MYRFIIFLLFVMLLHPAGAHSSGETGKMKFPGNKTYMFRVFLKDKHGTPFDLDAPENFLSVKSIERRNRQNIKIDSTDLPVNPVYVDSINAIGVNVVSRSKWNNTVLVRSDNLSLFKKVASLGFVKGVKKVWTSPDSIEGARRRSHVHKEFNSWDTIGQNYYGVAGGQAEMLGGEIMHQWGFTGNGITIAVLDGGFMNVDLIPCMKGINLIGWADFVVPPSENLFKEIDHGTKVLSVMAVKVPNVFVGTAPDASYWLLRCEDDRTESPAEEDYWAAAVEFADSVGADIISSSLGFHDFDDSSLNYKYSQLDGHTSLISSTASMLAEKGMVLVCSAGNDGMSSWKKINVPADAEDILTVGAVCPDGRNAAFSSIGPTADGRVKPDVMAQGSPTAVITGRGTIIKDMGTSFSTPLVSGMVACLWQALRDNTALEIINLVRGSADNTSAPDNIYGYGVPDFPKAYKNAHSAMRRMPVK